MKSHPGLLAAIGLLVHLRHHSEERGREEGRGEEGRGGEERGRGGEGMRGEKIEEWDYTLPLPLAS